MKENKTICQFLKITVSPDEPFVIKDSNGNKTYYEDSTGFWYKKEYDSNGKKTYYETSTGFWYKKEYDSNGKKTYYETSTGFWCKREYDSNGNKTYYEDSNGTTSGTKRTPCNGKTVVIDGIEYKLTQI